MRTLRSARLLHVSARSVCVGAMSSLTGFTNSENKSICSYSRDGKRQASSSLPGAWARDGRVIPQAQTGHIGRGEDMAPVDSDRPEHQGRPHPPATDQPGPRHRCDPSASTNDRLARHSTPNAASAPSHGGPLDTRSGHVSVRRRAAPGGAQPWWWNKGSSRPSRSGTTCHSAWWGDSPRHPLPSQRRALRNRVRMGCGKIAPGVFTGTSVTSGRPASALSSARSVVSYSAQGSNPV